ncbi:hypothetical protein NliqN6_3044 [Naganishia liquefaciens]|uniref:Uncharacterized protein n=1 Tax=Naganishia liquefaciens TaxID=104408 RepID=A0A8H3TT13_9TREE|nr:hypothetical protein NliqN6_3044 [Naganishia liquefaciens]
MNIPLAASASASASATRHLPPPSPPPNRPPGPPTYATLTAWLHHLLPAAPTHVPLIYHAPRTRPRQRHPLPIITRIICSVTATEGIYPLLSQASGGGVAAVVLHRPWDLDRRRVLEQEPSTLVLASHERLDESLTTGHNVPLLQRLGVPGGAGVSAGGMVPIVGYKGDPDRKIGLVARLGEGADDDDDDDDDDAPHTLEEWTTKIHAEFDGMESIVPSTPAERATYPAPRYIACMNAFEPPVIDRALAAAQSLSPEPINPQEIIYLTGQPRALGTTHAAERRIPCLFTGHRRAEVWAINYLAGLLREEFEGVEVVVVDEEKEEEEMQRRKREARRGKISRGPGTPVDLVHM